MRTKRGHYSLFCSCPHCEMYLANVARNAELTVSFGVDKTPWPIITTPPAHPQHTATVIICFPPWRIYWPKSSVFLCSQTWVLHTRGIRISQITAWAAKYYTRFQFSRVFYKHWPRKWMQQWLCYCELCCFRCMWSVKESWSSLLVRNKSKIFQSIKETMGGK